MCEKDKKTPAEAERGPAAAQDALGWRGAPGLAGPGRCGPGCWRAGILPVPIVSLALNCPVPAAQPRGTERALQRPHGS